MLMLQGRAEKVVRIYVTSRSCGRKALHRSEIHVPGPIEGGHEVDLEVGDHHREVYSLVVVLTPDVRERMVMQTSCERLSLGHKANDCEDDFLQPGLKDRKWKTIWTSTLNRYDCALPPLICL